MILGGGLTAWVFFCNCLSEVLFENQKFISLSKIFIYAVFYFTVGLAEEVLFRGYLETRLHALTKHIFLDVIFTGVLFVLMHFPYKCIAYNLSFLDFICNARYIADLFITHLIWSFIRIKSDCLYGTILPHWISDLAYNIVTHTVG